MLPLLRAKVQPCAEPEQHVEHRVRQHIHIELQHGQGSVRNALSDVRPRLQRAS